MYVLNNFLLQLTECQTCRQCFTFPCSFHQSFSLSPSNSTRSHITETRCSASALAWAIQNLSSSLMLRGKFGRLCSHLRQEHFSHLIFSVNCHRLDFYPTTPFCPHYPLILLSLSPYPIFLPSIIPPVHYPSIVHCSSSPLSSLHCLLSYNTFPLSFHCLHCLVLSLSTIILFS